MTAKINIIGTNKKAHFDYEIQEKLEAGIMLSGSEVKSLRLGKVNLKGSYVAILSDGPYVMDIHISPYSYTKDAAYQPKQKRKLLLNKKEIAKLIGIEKSTGLAIIPTQIYFKGGLVKLEIAIAKGKKLHDKRESLKKASQKLEINRALKNF